MKLFDIVKDDIHSFCKKYNFIYKNCDEKFYVLKGTIHVKDSKDDFIWDSFEVEYHILLGEYVKELGCKKNMDLVYPNILPLVYLTDHKEIMHPDFHITEKGLCCLSPDVECFEILSKNYNLMDFTEKLVIPFFANQVFFQKTGSWAYGEYKHFEEGLLDYYSEKMMIEKEQVLSGLKIVSRLNNINRNDKCFCGSEKKYKSCHLNILNAMIFHVPKFYFEKDYETLTKYTK